MLSHRTMASSKTILGGAMLCAIARSTFRVRHIMNTDNSKLVLLRGAKPMKKCQYNPGKERDLCLFSLLSTPTLRVLLKRGPGRRDSEKDHVSPLPAEATESGSQLKAVRWQMAGSS